MNLIAPFVLSFTLGASLLAQGLTCTSTLTGLGCGGSLDITFTPVGQAGNQDMTLNASGLHPDAFGLMVWGVVPINVPLGAGCSLLTDFVWGHTIQTDSLGEWSWSRTWPASSPGFYYIQFGSFVLDPSNNLELRVSDCKRAQCQ